MAIQESFIPTGFPYLDKVTGGLHPSELVIITDQSLAGKSAFALDIARNSGLLSLPLLK